MNTVILITLIAACIYALIRTLIWKSRGHTPDDYLNDKEGKYSSRKRF